MTWTFGSLFAGIGGFDLGLERAGWRGRWQVENDPYCVRVLEKHWPDVSRYGDVTELDPRELEPVDLICGGFPCQPVSRAGRRMAQADDRWLWPEFARVVRGVGPRFVLVENVPGLLAHGMGDVLGELASLGYDAEWESIPAAAVGAVHIRDRVFIVGNRTTSTVEGTGGERGLVANASGDRQRFDQDDAHRSEEQDLDADAERGSAHVADPRSIESGKRHEPDVLRRRSSEAEQAGVGGSGTPAVDNAGSGRHGPPSAAVFPRGRSPELSSWWAVEPDVGRVADGVPARVDRLRALGNAVVPQVVEWIGRRLMEVA